MEEEPNQFLKKLERKCLVDFYIQYIYILFGKVRDLQSSAREEEKEVKVRQKK